MLHNFCIETGDLWDDDDDDDGNDDDVPVRDGNDDGADLRDFKELSLVFVGKENLKRLLTQCCFS